MQKENTKIKIITAPCWKCDKNMLIALVGSETDLYYGPENFSEEEISRAQTAGVYLKHVFSKTAEESYLANTCKECGSFIGQWFYFAHYYAPALYGVFLFIEV